MKPRNKIKTLTLLLLAAMLAGCTATTESATHTTLEVRHSAYGAIITTKSGMTLYAFSLDTPHKTACLHGACTALWPPLIINGSLKLGPGINHLLVGKIKRPSGAYQLSYAKHPLYTFSADSRPGMMAGQGLYQFGGYWYVPSPTGNLITTKAK
ncbi:MAG: hypothetical protein M1483_04510 [Actinobacteria bacterium]|nr:hypothetical protein [Actinomycetota bacterium]MCL6104875.1 hypothetical protein [Actinomycetota bacterium]